MFFYHSGYAPLVRGLARILEAHQSIPGNRNLLIYYNPLGAGVFDKNPAFARFYAKCHQLGPEDCSDWGATCDSFVIFKATSDTRSQPHPGADAKIRVVHMDATVES